jgi:hypothetical protein
MIYRATGGKREGAKACEQPDVRGLGMDRSDVIGPPLFLDPLLPSNEVTGGTVKPEKLGPEGPE